MTAPKRSAEEQVVEDSAQLEPLLSHIARVFSQPLRFADADVQVGAAILALLRAAVDQAEVIQALKGKENAVAGIANVRVIFEIWADVHFILSEGDPHFNAVRNRAFGLMEFRDFAGADRERAIAQMCEERIERLRRASPAAVAAAEESRNRKKPRPAQLWSDVSRTAMLRALGRRMRRESTLSRLHKLLSFDAHGVIVGALNVDVDESGSEPSVQFYRRQEPADAWGINAGYAYRLLGETWNTVVAHLGLEDPDAS